MAIDIPNTDAVLDPAYAKAVIDRHFRVNVDTARLLADYWADLLQRCLLGSSPGSVSDLVLIAGFFRSALKAYDATLVCVDAGAIPGANIPLRTLWESDLYAKWIMKAGKDRWGKQAYVSDLRLERSWNRRLVPGTDEAKRYEAAWRDTFTREPPFSAEAIANAPVRVAEIDRLLARPSYQQINDWFDTARGGRAWDVEWYKPGPDAPTSVFDMAGKLDRKADYLTIYTSLSHHTHSSRPSAGFTIPTPGRVAVEPVRAFAELGTVFSLCTSLALRCMTQFLEHYRPEELQSFGKIYVERWRPYLTIPQIVEAADVDES